MIRGFSSCTGNCVHTVAADESIANGALSSFYVVICQRTADCVSMVSQTTWKGHAMSAIANMGDSIKLRLIYS